MTSENSNALSEKISGFVRDYAKAEEAAGRPPLMNDMLAALAHVMGSMIARCPRPLHSKMLDDLGELVVRSITMHEGAGPAREVVLVKRDGEGGLKTISITRDGKEQKVQ